MTLRVKIIVSAFAGVAALGLGSDRGGTEPMTAASAVGQAVSLDGNGVMRGWRTTPADLSTPASGHVASAKVQLDLSKLTMADFGDVEPAR